ncbi:MULTISPECIES: hypothetical protein [Shewanella]|nr:hypothetical protein [Shewanella sp. MM_2022_3]
MKFLRFIPIKTASMLKCPNCGSSDDIIRYDGGWCCRDCGYEWD